MALQYFLEILKFEPNESKYHNKLGVVYFTKGDLDNAVKCYETAYSLNSEDQSLLYNIGMVNFSKEDYAGAVQFLEQALQKERKINFNR